MKPPSRHAIPPKNNGPPDASTSFMPVKRRSRCKKGVIHEMKNDQPALLQKYIRLNDHRVRLRNIVHQERGRVVLACARPTAIRARSAAFTPGSSRGVSL